ncbi:integrin beta-PS-like [Haliotis rufescens]|uniref:integrin beta-PS-like n=1 Tax=Haliotis rufescens TaxID=6454 RepID=UPI00201EB33E|nr:integrin beta-PS-like [Haliotis rufescens]
MMWPCLVLVLIAQLLQPAFPQTASRLESNPCTNAATCGECIRTSAVCAWCASEGLDQSISRCDLQDHLLSSGACKKEDIQAPASNLNVTKDEPVQGGDGTEEAVQVQPQAINLRVRPNEAVKFKVQFRQAENYPVDLYFLLDMSHSMVKEKDAQTRLINLGLAMKNTMVKITKDFRLGFGTFVDKLAMPYVAWTKKMLEDRCPSGVQCRRPHDFQNQMALTKNMTIFADRMREALSMMSQSLDDPEGGMDGMMQVLSCDDPIGWRKRSRRMVVYSSNSWFHLAGDGKLGGAVGSNDGECHLDTNGEYSGFDTVIDYPSVSQLAKKVKDTRTNVVFAVMNNVYNVHQKLSGFLEGSAIDKLAEASENIIELVRNNYDKLRSKIEFKPVNAENIQVTFKSKCNGTKTRITNECTGLELGESVVFDVEVNVSPELCKKKTHTFDIAAVGLSEKLTVNLDLVCECDCEKPGQEQPASDLCSGGNGTFECGQCTCNPNRYGRVCECDEGELSSQESIAKCQKDPNSTVVCSGHGDCVCGVCECYTIGINTARRYSRAFCECNDYACDYYDLQLCGGPTRGVCKCGNCQCLPGFKGDNCGCSTRNDTCEAENGVICNGEGECVCGKCECQQGTNYIGPTCSDCPTCPSKCSQYKSCAQCLGFGTGEYDSVSCTRECTMKWEKQSTVEDRPQDGIKMCRSNLEDGCLILYSYEYNEQNDIVLKIQEKKECPEEVPVMAIALGIPFAILFIGILIILLILFIKRRREAKEYAEFLKVSKKAKWESESNPIYRDPKSTYQNPTYKALKEKETLLEQN